MNPDSKESSIDNNLLTNFDRTMALIDQVEGEAYRINRHQNAQEALEKLKRVLERTEDLRPEPDLCIATFTGDGSTRWNLMANGEVKFSGFHDQATGDKMKRAQELGFKLFE